jgi:aminoglycoside phosphotransferase (APT) family kinase protein
VDAPDPPAIDAALVRRLVDEQLPGLAGLPVRVVDVDGWDNRTFRLGDELTVRLPSGPGYASQVEKEVTHLPTLAAALSLPVPEVVAVGEPGAGYPFRWTVRRWIDGDVVRDLPDLDQQALAADVAAFLHELQAADPASGPAAGAHSQGRGAPPQQWDAAVADALARLADRVDADRAAGLWRDATDAHHAAAPVWFHGDVAVGNLLARHGRLSAVIDFGCCGVGDPAADLVLAWTALDDDARRDFRAATGVDDGTWARAAGWALWKALITLGDRDRVRDREAQATLRRLRVLA